MAQEPHSTLYDEGNGLPYWWDTEAQRLSPMAMEWVRETRRVLKAAKKTGGGK